MARLPTYLSTAKSPSSTGFGSPPAVLNQDQTGQALQQLGGVGQKIAEDMFRTRNEQAVNQATLGSMIKLNRVQVELGKLDPTDALAQAPGRIQQVYDEQIGGMNRLMRQAFDKKFMTLNAQTQINVQAQAVKHHNDQQQAGLAVLLDGLKRGQDPNGSAVSAQIATQTAFASIDAAVAGNVIRAEEGAKLKIKFRDDMAVEGVTKWFNNQTGDTLMDAWRQMDTDSIQDPAVANLWKVLPEEKKKSLTAQAVTTLQRMQSFADKEDKRREDEQKKQGKQALNDLYRPQHENETDAQYETRQSVALEQIKNNPAISIATAKQAFADAAGQSDQFDDQETVEYLQLSILRSDQPGEDINEEKIINAPGISMTTKKRLIADLRASEGEEIRNAKEIIRNHPSLVAKDKVDAMLNKDQLNQRQARVFNSLMQEYLTRRKRDNFNPTEWVNKYFQGQKDMEVQRAAQLKQQALTRLEAMGIQDRATGLDKINSRDISPAQRRQLQKDLSLVFPEPSQ